MKKLASLLCLLLTFSDAYAVGKVQQQGFKTLAECQANGATGANCLLLDSQVWVSANGINQQLSSAITAGALGGGGGGGVQLLSNPSFENGSTLTGWTTAAGTASVNTTTFYAGNQAASIAASSQQSTLTQDVTLTQNYQSVNMEASCKVNTSLAAQVCARTGGANIQCTSVPASSTWQYVPVNFSGPTSGSIGVQVGLTSSQTGTLLVDDCYVGPARNIGTVAQEKLVGQIKITGCAGAWSSTSLSMSAFSVQTGCTYTVTSGTTGSAPSTMIPGITFSSLPAGNYILKYEGAAVDTASSTSNVFFQFTDGTHTALEFSTVGAPTSGNTVSVPGFQQTISYPTDQSNITLQINAQVESSGGTASIYGTSVIPGVISVYQIPTQSQQAYNPSQAPAHWSGWSSTATGTTTCGTASNTFADPSPCTSTTLTANPSGNVNFGTVTQASGLAGIVVNFPKSGTYNVCAIVTASVNTQSSPSIRLVDGSGTVVNPGVTSTVLVSGFSTLPVCGHYVASSLSPTTLKVQFAQNAGNIYLENGPSSGSQSIIWTIDSLDVPQSMPFLQGNVTSTSSGSEHIERANINANCSVSSQSGSWITNTSGTSTSSTCNYSFASTEWSSLPSCTCTSTSAVANAWCEETSFSTSGISLTTFTNSSTGAANTISIICMGPH